MATYKVPQDVEAEDKLVGPLTFKQFIFLLIAVGAALMAWFMAQVHPLLIVVPLPVILVFGGLAVFRREDQPMERYLLSFFNFLLRPKQRIWSPEGNYDHLIITAPKNAEAPPQLKQDVEQARGQLEKLAKVVDTRGWATKRPELTLPSDNQVIGSDADDRLFMPDKPQEPEEVHEREDMLDDDNPEARNLDNMLQQHTLEQREQLLQNIRQQVSENATATVGTPKQSPPPTEDNPPAPQSSAPANNQPEPAQQSGAETTQPVAATAEAPLIPEQTGAAADGQNPPDQSQAQPRSDILEVSDQISVSQLAAQANRDSDQLEEGEEVKLR